MEDRGNRRVEEVYTIGQVALMTGVPENTIRSWERRFGIPLPERSGSNQRTYSRANIDIIASLQASRQRGRTMEQAIRDLNQVPVEPAQTGSAGTAPQGPPASEERPDISLRLMRAIEKLDSSSANELLAESLWASSIDDVCFDVLLKLDDWLAAGRAEGRISRVQLRFGEDWINRKLVAAFDASNPDEGRLGMVMASIHDSDTRILSLCHALALSRAGYRVHWAGSSVSVADVSELLGRLAPAALLLFARSRLSQAALRAALVHLGEARDSGGWHGLVAISGNDASGHPFALSIAPDASRTIDRLEAGLRMYTANLRLVETQ